MAQGWRGGGGGTAPQKRDEAAGAVRLRSAPRCWMHQELVIHLNCSHDSCTIPRSDLCGAFFLSKTRENMHTFTSGHFAPNFWMHQKRLQKRLLLLVANFCPGGLGLGLGLTVFHQSGDPLGPTLSFSQHRCAHTHWNRTSASQQLCISLGQTVRILRITARSGLEAEMIRLQGRKTVTSRLCKALVTNPHVLLAEVASDSASKPIVGPYSQSVPVSVHEDRIGQAAIWCTGPWCECPNARVCI